MANDMSWKTNITCALGKAQQRLFYLRKLKKKFPQGLMVNFYHCAVKSILTYGLLVWFSSCTSAEKEALHRVVKAGGGSLGRASQRSPQSSPPAAYAGWTTSFRTSYTQRTISSSDCPLDEDTVPSAPGPTDWPTASIHRLSDCWTSNLPPASPTQPSTPRSHNSHYSSPSITMDWTCIAAFSFSVLSHIVAITGLLTFQLH